MIFDLVKSSVEVMTKQNVKRTAKVFVSKDSERKKIAKMFWKIMTRQNDKSEKEK